MLEDCVSLPVGNDTDALAPCAHEEAVTWIFLHVAASTVAGHRRVIVRSSDFVVLAIATDKLDKRWIAFGVRRHFRFRSVPV